MNAHKERNLENMTRPQLSHEFTISGKILTDHLKKEEYGDFWQKFYPHQKLAMVLNKKPVPDEEIAPFIAVVKGVLGK